jgi:hypothetical protein
MDRYKNLNAYPRKAASANKNKTKNKNKKQSSAIDKRLKFNKFNKVSKEQGE